MDRLPISSRIGEGWPQLAGGRWRRFVACVAAGLLWGGAAPAVDFELEPLVISDYHLDDLGVVDVNRDGNIDIFTTNHNGQQLMSIGRGDGSFENVDFEALGMPQNPEAPGLADSEWTPDVSRGGLYIYLRRGRLHVRRVAMKDLGPIRGTLYLHHNPKVTGTGFSHTAACDDGPRFRCRVDFELEAPGTIRFKATLYQLPKRLVLDEAMPLDRIYLGAIHATPESHDLTLRLMDRHALAWSDVNGDGTLDAFISNGAARGTLDQVLADFPESDPDNEFFCQYGGVFERCPGFTGLERAYGRARGVAWVDFNNAGRLDLYLNNHETPNRLWKRRPGKAFQDRAPALGLDMLNSGPAVWFDADNDLDADMLIAEDDSLVLYRRVDGGYQREKVGNYRGAYKLWNRSKFSLFDLGGDGYLDALIASPKGSSLITNEQGKLTSIAANKRGLPDQAFSLDFVDTDNDGLPEVHAVSRDCSSDGLYVMGPDGRFSDTGALPALRLPDCGVTRSLWFDADNNGFPDLLLSRKEADDDTGRLWDTGLLRNLGNDNHWLQLRLRGPRRNREAIGAHVIVTAGDRALQQQVGQFEGSSYSQGHYRLYFGLGAADRVDRIEVLWPDGTRTTRENVSPDRLLTIAYDRP